MQPAINNNIACLGINRRLVKVKQEESVLPVFLPYCVIEDGLVYNLNTVILASKKFFTLKFIR